LIYVVTFSFGYVFVVTHHVGLRYVTLYVVTFTMVCLLHVYRLRTVVVILRFAVGLVGFGLVAVVVVTVHVVPVDLRWILVTFWLILLLVTFTLRCVTVTVTLRLPHLVTFCLHGFPLHTVCVTTRLRVGFALRLFSFTLRLICYVVPRLFVCLRLDCLLLRYVLLLITFVCLPVTLRCCLRFVCSWLLRFGLRTVYVVVVDCPLLVCSVDYGSCYVGSLLFVVTVYLAHVAVYRTRLHVPTLRLILRFVDFVVAFGYVVPFTLLYVYVYVHVLPLFTRCCYVCSLPFCYRVRLFTFCCSLPHFTFTFTLFVVVAVTLRFTYAVYGYGLPLV
jgi:hypothetical protein